MTYNSVQKAQNIWRNMSDSMKNSNRTHISTRRRRSSKFQLIYLTTSAIATTKTAKCTHRIITREIITSLAENLGCAKESWFLPSLSPAVSTPFRRGGARGPEKRVVGLKKRRRKGKKRGETKEGLAEGRKKGSSRRNNKASSREDVFFPPSRGEKKKRDPRPSSCVCTHTRAPTLAVPNPLRTDPVCTPHALSPLPRLSINWRVKQRSYRVGNYLLSFCGPCVTYSEITRRRGNIGEGMERPGILAPSL